MNVLQEIQFASTQPLYCQQRNIQKHSLNHFFDTLPLTSQFLESRLIRHCVQLFLYLNAIQSFQPLQLSSFHTCLYYTRATLDLLFLKHVMNALPLYCIYAFFLSTQNPLHIIHTQQTYFLNFPCLILSSNLPNFLKPLRLLGIRRRTKSPLPVLYSICVNMNIVLITLFYIC